MARPYSKRRTRGACEACVTHTCRECEVEKPISEFYVRKRPDGTTFHRKDCISCVCVMQQSARMKDPEKYRAYTRNYYVNNAWRARDSSLRKKYGITYADFVAMYEAQGGRCRLCSRKIALSKGSHVDHDHQTGKVRSLLCHHCNTGIGNLQDDPDLLLAAALYVLSHREESSRELVAG